MDVRAGILEVFTQIGREPDPRSSGSLIEEGILDSMSILELISGLEQHFGIVLEDDTLTIDAFAYLPAIEGLVSDALESGKHAP